MRLIRYVFFAYCIAEIASLVAMGSWVGVGWTFLLLTAACVGGCLLISKMGKDVMAILRRGSLQAHDIAAALPGAHLRLFAGLFLISPGFVSDLLALVLLLPPVQNFAHEKVRRWLERHAPKPQGGVVIDGEAVEVPPVRARIDGPNVD